MKKRQWITSVLVGVILAGCGQLNSNMQEFTMPEMTENRIVQEARNTVERMAAEKHVKPELSDEFISQYLDMNSFEELKQRTKEGILATQDMAEMTEKEFQLWEDIIDTEMLNQYTTDDLEAKKAELKNILKAMAEEKNMDIETMVEETYQMDKEELNAFLEKQVDKYLHIEADSIGTADDTKEESENLESTTKEEKTDEAEN